VRFVRALSAARLPPPPRRAGCLVSFNIVNNIHAIMHPRAHSTAGAPRLFARRRRAPLL
jgi:hypothetical protein